MSELSIYVHIPLCSSKCPYCHFFTIPNKKAFRDALVKGLFLEWERVRSFAQEKKIVSLYFGGGTPLLLGAKVIGKVVEEMGVDGECEITLEANPEKVTERTARRFVAVGINRLSLGVVSLDDALLKRLGRGHSAMRAREALFEVAAGGIENLSIDLLYDIPYLDMRSWSSTLEELSHLPLSHLSLYNLTFEPRTPFFKRRSELTSHLPSDEESKEMLEMAVETCATLGLKRYEISAFAAVAKESIHNVGYWTGREFLGLGPSAFSYVGGRRFRNVANLHKYVHALKGGGSAVDFEERLPYPQSVRELLAIGLRVLAGVDLAEFRPLPKETDEVVERLCRDGYLEKEGSVVRLTNRGRLFYDTVATEIV